MYSLPQLIWTYLVITMHKDMAHTLYIIPINFGMLFSELKSKFVHGFTNNFHLLDISIEYYWVSHHFFQSMTIFVCQQHVDC